MDRWNKEHLVLSERFKNFVSAIFLSFLRTKRVGIFSSYCSCGPFQFNLFREKGLRKQTMALLCVECYGNTALLTVYRN